MSESPAPKTPPSPHERVRTQLRRARILVSLRRGADFHDIARDENLSVSRVRRVISDGMRFDLGRSAGEHALQQLGRLESASRVVRDAMAAGDLRAVDRFLRVLERTDRYQQTVAAERSAAKGPNSAKKTLIRKIDHALRFADVERVGIVERLKRAEAAAGVAGPPLEVEFPEYMQNYRAPGEGEAGASSEGQAEPTPEAGAAAGPEDWAQCARR